jgi:cytochrome c oxidase assembly factor CtaG
MLGSFGLLWFATASRFATLGMTHLPLHMIGHVLVMFLVPIGLVLSGASRSWWWLLPVQRRRRVLRWWYVTRSWRVRHTEVGAVASALVLNVVMVAAHVGNFFDFSMSHDWAMNWLMEPAFFFSGLWFFHFLLPSVPRHNALRLRIAGAMVIGTMAEMLLLAMSMSIFSKGAWYRFTAHMPGMGGGQVIRESFHDQQLAAAILWICGDFWAVPILVLLVRRLIQRNGGLLAAIERQGALFSKN